MALEDEHNNGTQHARTAHNPDPVVVDGVAANMTSLLFHAWGSNRDKFWADFDKIMRTQVTVHAARDLKQVLEGMQSMLFQVAVEIKSTLETPGKESSFVAKAQAVFKKYVGCS